MQIYAVYPPDLYIHSLTLHYCEGASEVRGTQALSASA
jgi:hypothetical protein